MRENAENGLSVSVSCAKNSAGSDKKNVKRPGGGSAETVLSDKMEQNVCFAARFGISYK